MNRSSYFNGKIVWLLLLAIAFALAACSSDKGKTSGGSEEETQGIAITDKTVAGVTQKGPFINGSSVTLFELNGVDLLQTGNSFVGKIKSDKGDFSISGINLVSPYALLEAKGYYRNEVTGKKSVSEIALNAVTNLENRDNVNVNLLTHLEYERVQGLVKKNIDIASAKEQAEKEIFTSFYVDEDVESFEDLNIFKTGEDDAVLLAISVLMQGERSEAELSELLANYSYDVESDGVWNDEEAKAEIADWAEMQTLSAGLENIRKNIEDWKFGSAPGFEKYVMHFWWFNYGLGLCSTKNEGSIKKNENDLSANVNVRYICKNNFWYRYGERSDSSEVVSSSSTNESEISSSSDESVLSSSAKDDVSSSSTKIESSGSEKVKSSSSVVPKSSSSVVQDSSSSEMLESSSSAALESSSSSDGNLFGWDDAEDGTVRSNETSGPEYYVYDESEGWRLSTTKYDYELGVGGCTVKRNRQKVRVYDDRSGINFNYVCYNKKWYSDLLMNWDLPKDVYLNDSIAYGSFTDDRDGKIYKTVQIGTQTWMAENLNYTDSQNTPSLQKRFWCYDGKEEYCNVTGALYTWEAAVDSIQLYNDFGLQCDSGHECYLNQGANGTTITIRGICPEGWHLPSKMEYETMVKFVGQDLGFYSKNMMSNFGWKDDVDDEYGTTFIPSGFRPDVGYFVDVGNFAYLWTSTIYSRTAYHFIIGRLSRGIVNNRSNKYGMSVRCVKD